MKDRANGFTLIELMITVTIIAILTMVALPSYRNYIIRANRAAAQAEMMAIANREEQYLLSNRAYADKATLAYGLPTEVGANYDWDVVPGTGTLPSYLITFTAKGSQVSDGDLTLSSAGVKTPVDKWKR
jgi:type IV pilus assembly protein PilE